MQRKTKGNLESSSDTSLGLYETLGYQDQYTVKPAMYDHALETKKAALNHRWPLIVGADL